MNYKIALIYMKRTNPMKVEPGLVYKEFIGETRNEARLAMLFFIKDIMPGLFRRGGEKYKVIEGESFNEAKGAPDIFIEIENIKKTLEKEVSNG